MTKVLEYDNSNYRIKWKKDNESSYGLIYSLELIELETLKAYIKTNLVNSFIQLFKFFASTLILFN